MTQDDILKRMQAIINGLMGKEDISLTLSTKLTDLGVDSIELMEFIINLEDDFAVEIPDEAIDQMTQVSDLIAYLLTHVDQA